MTRFDRTKKKVGAWQAAHRKPASLEARAGGGLRI